MNLIPEAEQQYRDYGFFLVDKHRKIGHFPYTERAVPSVIAKSLKNWQMLCSYFYSLPIKKDNYKICNSLQKHLDSKSCFDIDNYLEISIEMSSRGIYVYDNFGDYDNDLPYFRALIPKIELKFYDLPNEVQKTLESLIMNNIDFAEDSLINEKSVAAL